NRCEWRGFQAQGANKVFLGQPVLGGFQRPLAGMKRFAAGQIGNRRARQILELECDGIADFGETGEHVVIVIGSRDLERRNLEGRRVVLVIVDRRIQSQPRRRHGQHATQLAAADNADHAARRDGFQQTLDLAHLGDLMALGIWATERVCLARQALSRASSPASLSAKMAAACSAAFLAPASPIANVATGTPPGIWAMERSESNPFRARLSTGTPRTGRVVMLATMPGRWSAPPAPAMITWMPRSPASLAYWAMRSGVR